MTAEELRKLAESVSIPRMSVDRAAILALVSELEALREAVKLARERFDQIDCMTWGGQRIQTMADAFDQMKAFAQDGSQRLAALTKENSHV